MEMQYEIHCKRGWKGSSALQVIFPVDVEGLSLVVFQGIVTCTIWVGSEELSNMIAHNKRDSIEFASVCRFLGCGVRDIPFGERSILALIRTSAPIGHTRSPSLTRVPDGTQLVKTITLASFSTQESFVHRDLRNNRRSQQHAPSPLQQSLANITPRSYGLMDPDRHLNKNTVQSMTPLHRVNRMQHLDRASVNREYSTRRENPLIMAYK